MNHAIILFAHGSRDPSWALPFERLVHIVKRRLPDRGVALAFLESMAPNLSDALAGAVAQGAREVTIVPLFLATGGHLREDLPRMVAQAAQRHEHLVIRVSPPIGESDEVLEAIAAWVSTATR